MTAILVSTRVCFPLSLQPCKRVANQLLEMLAADANQGNRHAGSACRAYSTPRPGVISPSPRTPSPARPPSQRARRTPVIAIRCQAWVAVVASRSSSPEAHAFVLCPAWGCHVQARHAGECLP